MKYIIRDFQAPNALVEYISNDGRRNQFLNIRIETKLDNSLPQGKDLDEYILSYSPDLDTIPIDPYANIDWSDIQSKIVPIEKTKEQEKLEIIYKLQQLDQKSIRALRENNTDRINEIEAEAVLLRIELSKLG